jgi:cytochrome c553
MTARILVFLALACPGAGLLAEQPARNLASACAICHGSDGRAASKDLGPLAGLPREYIAAQMRAFRDAKRPATVMHQIAKGYSDAEIDALAAWFASLKR